MHVLYAVVAFLLSSACVTSVSAKSPSDTYLAYIKAVKQSTSWDDLLPLLTAKDAGPIRAMPTEKRKRLHEFYKSIVVDRKNIKVISEETTGKKAIVIATYCDDGRQGKETTPLRLENGTWGIGKGNSEGSLTSCRTAQSPADTYLAYIKAVQRSSSWDDLLPLLTAENAAPIRTMPIEKRRELHDFYQPLVIGRSKIKVISVKQTGKRAIVIAAYCEDGKQGQDTTPLLLENGTWGVGKGNSELSLKPCAKQAKAVAATPTKKTATHRSNKRKVVKRKAAKRYIRKKRSRRRQACGGTFMYRKGRKCVDARS
ncbi:MAG: hypothetical protein ACR2PI_06270 [Hyphomicrobiaceae bacterium]